jgi:hypothetical protein
MNKHILKIIIALSLIIIAIFSWGYYCSRLLTTTSKDLDNTAATLETLVKDKNWDEADKRLSELQENWDRTEPKWAILIDHFEIDNIDNSMVRMSKLVEEKSSEDALAELGALRKFIQHIPLKNALSIKNVL